MSVLLLSRNERERAFRADLEGFISNALNAPDATVRDLARLYATSTTAYRAANIRAEALSQVPFKVTDRAGTPLDDHPLNRIVRHNDDLPDIVLRAELSLCFFGDTLIFKRRMVSGRVTGLQWVNPHVYRPEVDLNGLRGFSITHYGGTYDQVDATFIAPNDGIYLHGVDFDDDYGGVSPAENAFEQAGVEAEAALTALSFMRNRAIPLSVLQPADKDAPAPNETVRMQMIELLRRVAQGARNAGRTLVAGGRWEWVQLQQKFDEVGMKDFYEEARIAVSMAFSVPLDLLLPSESSYAAHYMSNKGWVDYWLRPRANWYARGLTKQLAGEWGDDIRLEPDLSAVLQQDKKASTEVVNAQLQGGYLSLYQAQIDAGIAELDIALKDYYMFNGTPVHKSKIPLLADRLLLGTSHVALPSPITLGASAAGDEMDETPAMLPPRPPAASAARMSSSGTPSATVLLRLENTRTVEAIQAHLRVLLPDDDRIRWTAPGDLHVTLVSIPVMSDAQAVELQQAFGPSIDRALVELGPVATFEQDDQTVVILDVHPDEAIRALQEQMIVWLAQHQIPISAYSMPTDWHPHVTLAHSAVLGMDVPEWAETVAVHTDRIELSRTAYQTTWVIPPARSRHADVSLSPAQFDELITASRVLARRGGSYAFEPATLPLDAIALLRVLATTGETQDAMYRHVRALLCDQALPSAARADGDYATLETQYRAALYELVRSAFAHQVDRRAFGDRGRREISRAFAAAYTAGLAASGMKDGDALTDDETEALKALTTDERSYWTALANELYRTALPLWDESQDLLAQLDGETDPHERDRLRSESLQTLVKFYRVRDQFLNRIDMWVKTLRGVYHQALLSGRKNPMVKWTLGPTTEHCRSCLAAAGQVHRRSTWDKYGIRPQVRTLECTGRKCGCTLEVTTERASGNIRKIPLFSADRAAPDAHEHAHDDDPAEVAHA